MEQSWFVLVGIGGAFFAFGLVMVMWTAGLL